LGNPLRHLDGPGPLVVAAGLAVLVCLSLLAHIAELFQNLYQSSFIFLRGSQVAHTYWASVAYGLGMAVLIGALVALLMVIVAIEMYRHARRRW
jgi:hypothetical protein